MDAQATAPLLRFFKDLPDPRRHNVRHMFTDILTLALLGVLCRCNDWSEVVLWARAEIGFLSSILTLRNGIPSADTFRRVFSRIHPQAFEACFVNWMNAVAGQLKGQVVAIDGKSLRHSFEHAAVGLALRLGQADDSHGQRLCGGRPAGAGATDR